MLGLIGNEDDVENSLESSRLEPLVSVIVPIYNSEQYIEACLQSIMGQTVSDIEVICVDDGSTDRSSELVRQFAEKDSRVLLLSQDNRGGGAARNTGLTVAKGVYLLFVDADDWIEPDLLEVATGRAEATEADVVLFRAYEDNMALGTQREVRWVFRKEFIPNSEVFNYRDMNQRIFNAFGNVPWNKLFRRSFVVKNGLRFQEVRRTNDLYFVCASLVLADKLSVCDRVLTHYRTGMTTNSQATNERDPLGFFKAFSELKRFLESEGLYDALEQAFLNHALNGVVSNLYTLKSSESFMLVCRALRNDMEQVFSFGSHGAGFYWDKVEYSLYRALVGCAPGDELLAWSRELLLQRNEAWRIGGEKISELQSELDSLSAVACELEGVKASRAYKIGLKLTSPYRALKALASRD